MHINETVKKLDKYRCRVWGCGAIFNLEVHHIIPRGKQGPDESWNLITLCKKHHDLVTLGKCSMSMLLIKLEYKLDFRWGKALSWHLNRNRIRKTNE